MRRRLDGVGGRCVMGCGRRLDAGIIERPAADDALAFRGARRVEAGYDCVVVGSGWEKFGIQFVILRMFAFLRYTCVCGMRFLRNRFALVWEF